MSPGEQHLLDDLNEFVRQTSDLLEDEPKTSGIRPPPQIEVTETTLDTTRFGFEFGPKPEAQVEPSPGGPLMGACCFEDGSCVVETAQQCLNDGGTYQGDNSDCTPNPCPGGDTSPCCFSDGHCEMLTTPDCLDAGGHPSDADNCDDPNTCLGGCCDPSTFLCSVESLDDCIADLGTWVGYGTDCTGVDCTCCPFFAFYNTVRFSGTITGCGATITLPEQIWTKVAYPPSLNEFSILSCTAFIATTCAGTDQTAILIDSDGNCTTGEAYMTADFATACGPYVLFTGTVNDCNGGGPVQVGGTDFEDFSSGSLTVAYDSGSGQTFTFNLTAE